MDPEDFMLHSELTLSNSELMAASGPVPRPPLDTVWPGADKEASERNKSRCQNLKPVRKRVERTGIEYGGVRRPSERLASGLRVS